MNVAVRLDVNGTERTITTDAARPLLDVLREDLHLTGTKYGCGEGQCGACLVHLDGVPTRSCLLPVKSADGKAVTTIEGLAQGEPLHAVQRAFIEEGAMQCGYCRRRPRGLGRRQADLSPGSRVGPADQRDGSEP